VSPDLDAAARAASSLEGGLLARARRFVGALLEHIATRGELLSIELAEEKERLVHVGMAAGLLLVAALMAFVFLGVLVLVLAWDTDHRVLVAALIPVVFIALAAGAWLWLKRLIIRKTALFRDSLRELKQDAQSLRAP